MGRKIPSSARLYTLLLVETVWKAAVCRAWHPLFRFQEHCHFA